MARMETRKPQVERIRCRKVVIPMNIFRTDSKTGGWDSLLLLQGKSIAGQR